MQAYFSVVRLRAKYVDYMYVHHLLESTMYYLIL